jgi:hypothetical protein
MKSSTASNWANWVVWAVAVLSTRVVVAADSDRAVVELFTSQGCSSCPPADAIVGRLRSDPAVIVLSFHVNYWDGPQWRDPFSSQAVTDRQYAYGRALGESTVFTPQLIVNGTHSLIGSQESAIHDAIGAERRIAFPVQADLSRQPDGTFALTLKGPAISADLWEIMYVQHTATQIRGGENGGRRLDTFNDVTRIRRLGAFSSGTLNLPPLISPANGLAVIVQAPGLRKILGAAAYEVR